MADDPQLAQAVRLEAWHRLVRLLEGIRTYRNTQYQRAMSDLPVVWQQGGCRLLYCGGLNRRPRASDPPALLLIPSLINRYTILDLNEERSFARYLAAQGKPVYLVDWGEPDTEEKKFNCADYISQRLAPMAEHIRRLGHQKTVAVGHCLGGMLALGLSSGFAHLVDAQILLAAPWDFSQEAMGVAKMPDATLRQTRQYISGLDVFAGDHLLAMFYLRDPWGYQDKLRCFADMERNTPQEKHFVAVEDWANDFVPIAKGVAQDALLNWGQENQALRGLWRVNGRRVDPAWVKQPSLLVVPQEDRIVPPASSQPLVDALPNGWTLTPTSGHVGMVVGSRGKAELWEPLVAWVDEVFLHPTRQYH